MVQAYGEIFTEDELFTPVVVARHMLAGQRVLVIGSAEVEQPSVEFLRLAAASAGVSDFGDIWVVGDDRTTDVPMAHDAGARAVPVRTGKYADQRDLPEPGIVLDSIADLPGVLATSV